MKLKLLAPAALLLSALCGVPLLVHAQDVDGDPVIDDLILMNTTLSVSQNGCSVSDAESKARYNALANLCGLGYRVENVVCDPCTVVPSRNCSSGQGVSCTCTGTCVRNVPTPTPTPTPAPKTQRLELPGGVVRD